jgi:hypothetical protein
MMFAGLPELFVILVVVFAAWHVVKAFNKARPPAPPPRRQPEAPQRAMIQAEDLVSCRACGTYIAASTRYCGRAGCPQPR